MLQLLEACVQSSTSESEVEAEVQHISYLYKPLKTNCPDDPAPEAVRGS
jgi:hypothetical protein